jgi:hypothetical protein
MMSNDTTQATQDSAVTDEDADGEDQEGRPEKNASINVSLDEENYIWPQFFSRIRETLYLDSSSAAQEQPFGHLQMVCEALGDLNEYQTDTTYRATMISYLHQRKPIGYAERFMAFLRVQWRIFLYQSVSSMVQTISSISTKPHSYRTLTGSTLTVDLL